jgi:signal transduction histidine kinase
MGAGICSMHYVGMAAIRITPAIHYDPFWVATSFVIAIGASFAALWVAFSSRENRRWWRYHIVLGAIAMGFAIAGMHYAGMVAARFPANAVSLATAFVDKPWLAGAVTTISVFVLFAALLISMIEAQGRARTAAMQASLTQAHRSSQAKDEFLAMLGHELRNPLAAISNAAHLLDRSEPGSPRWQLAREVIGRQSSHLGTLVDDLLDVGRAINGRIALDMQPMDLGEVPQAAIRTLRAAGKARQHRIDYRGTSSWVRADPTRMEQIVTNLLTNALNNTPEDGRIDVQVRSDGDDAVLTVSDTGVGLDPDSAAHVFDLFFQASQDVQRSKGGLGIGLTLVRRIVEMHGGTVSVASEGLGKGATFTVRMPAIAPRPEPEATTGAPLGITPRRVLIVEDSADGRESLQAILELAGHTITTAEDGVHGLHLLTCTNPDVALIDIGLPGMDGYEVARRARSSGSRALLIALTGYGLPEDKSRAQQAGFDAHLTKPAPMDSLLALIEERESIGS